MHFASDNGGPCPPQILQALAEANSGYAPAYGADAVTQAATDHLRRLFEAPQAAVYFVPTGTAANALALATLVQPFQTVYCTPMAHIREDECNAPEFYTGGAPLTLVPGSDRMTPEALRQSMGAPGRRAVHHAQHGALSLTNVAEMGNVYTVDEIAALCAVAREADMPVHLDGARFANACVRLGCTPAEMTWRAGVDVAVFGGTKNGCLGVEAVILFDSERAWEFELRRKRAGHLFSKYRYLSAQMMGYLQDDLWRDLAGQANARCDALAQGLERLGVEIVNPTFANMLFIRLPRRVHTAVMARGAVYHLWEGAEGPADEVVTGRLVCDWSVSEEAVAGFLQAVESEL
ncbi:threonine aldolase family protein [Pseudoponticoccus marisrubri]|uniref:Threonine aldolase n=1 Tax=Pseudoponticoccus marisrubri TaxID=1685382 RepID=A0A0W7WKI9_9RHOB|nr:beta-eliminating lyase-related protein [Pseudoponticoccus marisrubri]KUF11066.1 threonine aldolase [Pseudoponticoccus marisrubri]